MESTIWFTDGFVVITGEIGAGKTTLIETFLREQQSEAIVAQISQTQLSPTAFLADGPGAVRLLAVQHEKTRSAVDVESIFDRTAQQRTQGAAHHR